MTLTARDFEARYLYHGNFEYLNLRTREPGCSTPVVFCHVASMSYHRLNEKGSKERNELLRATVIGWSQPHATEVGQGLDTRKQREGLRKALLS